MLTEAKCSKVCFMIRSLGLKHHQAIKMVTALKRMLPPNLARALAKGTVMSWFCFGFFVFVFVFCFFYKESRFLDKRWSSYCHTKMSHYNVSIIIRYGLVS